MDAERGPDDLPLDMAILDEETAPSAEDQAAAKARSRALIGAARKVQGARSRRTTAAQSLFDLCALVRRRVKTRYRGPKHLEIRRAFGEGLPASPAKHPTVQHLAQVIQAAAAVHPECLKPAKVRPATLARIGRLLDVLRAACAEAPQLEQARRETRKAHGLPRVNKRKRRQGEP